MSKKHQFLTTLIGGLLVAHLPVVAWAEPSRVPLWLINEPMSLFDWGIYQTDKKLESFKEYKIFSVHYMGGFAQYDWEANRIKLQVMFQGNGTDTECNDNLKKAKGAFLNFTWVDAEYPRVAREVLADLFSHKGGYKGTTQPKDLGDQLSNITVLEAVVYVSGANGTLSPKVRCQTTFKSKDISVIRP
jgi:hypothetical protein